MDPALDPPPVSAQPTGAPPPADAPATAAANPTPAHSVPNNHPPYAEMIAATITALNERDGSSKRAIAKYIETHYSGLPPTHTALLTHHLKRLKANGQLVMVKKSYALPTRSTAASVNGDVNAVAADPATSGSKRRPGRPPKSNPDAGQAAVPVFAAPINMNAQPAAAGVHIAVGPAITPIRGRGRPPKRGPGRPPQSGNAGKQRGRPKKSAVVASVPAKGSGRPRGRPPKPANAVQGAPVGGGIPAVPVPVGASVGGKRRGRPPKAGGVAKKPRNMRQLSGKPVGRPRKNAAAVSLTNETPDSKLLDHYFNLNNELITLKTKVKDTVNVVRPFLNSDDAINALNELEAVAESASAPPGAPVQPQHPQPQPQPQPQQHPQPLS